MVLVEVKASRIGMQQSFNASLGELKFAQRVALRHHVLRVSPGISGDGGGGGGSGDAGSSASAAWSTWRPTPLLPAAVHPPSRSGAVGRGSDAGSGGVTFGDE